MNRVAPIAFVVFLYFSSPAFSGQITRPRLAVVNEAEIRRQFAKHLDEKIASQTEAPTAKAKVLRIQMLDWRVVLREGSAREPKRYEEAIEHNRRLAEKIDQEVIRLKDQIEADFQADLSKTIRKNATEIALENRFVHVHFFGLGGEGLMKNLRSRGFAEYRDITAMVMQRMEAARIRGE